MAYAQSRSVSGELASGSTDGKYRKVVADRGGIVESMTYDSRRDLSDTWFGLHECPSMVSPDGSHVVNPYAVRTTHAEPMGF